MSKRYQNSVHIFRRDLRLEDNTALIKALELSHQVVPCFILDERQINNNPYKSDNAVQFMIKSLGELNNELRSRGSRLYCFKGIAEQVIENLIKEVPIQAVFFNRDYTPFSKMRDENIRTVCKKYNIDCHVYADTLLNEPEAVVKQNGTPYSVYTHYLQKAKTFAVDLPVKHEKTNYYKEPIANAYHFDILQAIVSYDNPNIIVHGGRKEALALLQALHKLQDYQNTRNYPAIQGTSLLSAHIKFGTVSIRDVYHEAKGQLWNSTTFVNELYWRDFFTTIAFYFPYVFGQPFYEKYASLPWSDDEKSFERWKNGITGFPIVDAGMRQLNTTGWMHNRVRMIAASFLVKDLHIDWRRGEQYFAQTLIDYDPSVNNGNWQWAASTGCDAVPYFRIFNPWLQQKKYDTNCEYIKQWIPELRDLHPKVIHNWALAENTNKYPKPVVDHGKESAITRLLYKGINKF
ncbi:MAG: deoxyribodipyrimidine photo-lyase [Spirochaetota bacterium]